MIRTQQAVTILGAGTQGRRLAFMWSRRGRPVYLFDKQQTQLQSAKEEIYDLRNQWCKSSQDVGEWGPVVPGLMESLPTAAGKSWLLIECLPEIPGLKKEVLQELDNLAVAETIIASNSSSYTIQELLDGLNLKHDYRFISLHSYWPPETSAVEIMGSSSTNPEVLSLVAKEAQSHGFSPYIVRRSSTGYIYNRIWAAIKRETLILLSEDVATPEEVDAIFKDVLNTPKGPCEQMDVVGLDVVLDIENHYAAVRTGIPEEPRTYLKKMVGENKLGLKSRQGFYSYPAAA